MSTWTRWFFVYFLLGLLFIASCAWATYRKLSEDLPDKQALERIPEDQDLSSVVYSADGVELRSFQRENRYWVRYDDIPQVMIDATLSAEDSRFFQHWGVSTIDIARAMLRNVRNIGARQHGASTITQQLARQLFLNRKETYTRKLREAIVALDMERTYSKQEILELFLNNMYYGLKYRRGAGYYGIQAAARGFYGKDVSGLTVDECAMLAGLLQAPTRLSPKVPGASPDENARAKERRDLVLRMMVDNGKLSREAAREAMDKPIVVYEESGTGYGRAPWFVDYVRGILERNYGATRLETSGFKVHTTLDWRLQQIAERVLREQLDRIQALYPEKRRYNRPPGLTDEQAFADSLAKTVVQGALFAMDVRTGKILAMVGGRQYSSRNQFNRAVQAARQAGSSFKPFIYTAALDNGWRCSDTIIDAPVSYENIDGTFWEPSNFSEDYMGKMSVRDGFKLSRNIISVKLLNDEDNRGIGPQLAVQYARKFGITTPIPPYRALAVGATEVRLIEMVSAYTTFPNFGIRVEPFSIHEIDDKNGSHIFTMNEGAKHEVLKPDVASLMTTMLRSVVTEGTARIMIRYNDYGDRPAAGKTGTAQDSKDAWFIGFTPYIACGVWIGFDSEESFLKAPLQTGATAPLPVWRDFIKESSELLGYPADEFRLSNGLTTMQICRDSYQRATEYCPRDSVYTEYYLSGTEPREFCPIHGRSSSTPRNNRMIQERSPRGRGL